MNGFVMPLTLLLLADTIGAVGVFAVPILAPEVAPDLGVEASQIGVYSTLLFSGGMISSALAGNLVLGFGPIRVSQLAMVGIALGIAITTIATLPAFAIAALTIGLAYGLFTPAGSYVLARCSPPDRLPLIFSIRQTGTPIGGALTGAAIPVFALAYGWRAANIGIAIVCVLTAALLEPLRAKFDDDLQPGRQVRLRTLFQSWGVVLGDARLRDVCLAGVTYAVMQACISSIFVVYLVDDRGFDLVTAGLAQSTAQAAGVVGRIGWGALVGQTVSGRRMVGLLGLAMAAAALLMVLVTVEWPVAVLLATSAALGATGTGWSGVFFAEMARLAPEGEAVRAIGGASSITFTGAVFGPVGFSAFVAATDSYAGGFVLVALMTVLPAVVLLRPRAAT